MSNGQAQQIRWHHQNQPQQPEPQQLLQRPVQSPERRRSVTRKRSLECARDLECDRCARMFPTKRFIAQHLAPDKRKCQMCCKRFRHVSNLVNHVRVHTGEKPYTCAVCRKSFAQVGNLRTHVRGVHSGHTPFECDVCGRQFTQMGNLATHKRVHDADKPYACNECRLSYCQQYQLVRHQKKHRESVSRGPLPPETAFPLSQRQSRRTSHSRRSGKKVKTRNLL
ncbi:gastrula zinc finger protein XlCGF7.1-like [Rhopalosiphum maidis]|uniref:gastrula zinc finger protein XlCGF7.1-like n=1 Tax=Rhopalosiphum maidis TaxID=43146 RepID=UPI000EFED195|nr:gastrula zinc finger protein XlCGF7.1-like [Rhopalosiphum maidis]